MIIRQLADGYSIWQLKNKLLTDENLTFVIHLRNVIPIEKTVK